MKKHINYSGIPQKENSIARQSEAPAYLPEENNHPRSPVKVKVRVQQEFRRNRSGKSNVDRASLGWRNNQTSQRKTSYDNHR